MLDVQAVLDRWSQLAALAPLAVAGVVAVVLLVLFVRSRSTARAAER